MNTQFEPNFPFPDKSPCPKHLVERLMLIAQDVAHVFGEDSARDGVMITDKALLYIAAAIAAGLVTSTLDTLHRSTALLNDPQVLEWLSTNPPTP